jgi:hypothetical protein
VLPEPVAVTLVVTEALDGLGVPYLIGGSLASSVYGAVRSTWDTDLVADLSLEHARPLAEALSGRFFVDVDMILDAIRHRRHFNVVHLETMFKVDVFIPKQRDFDRMQIRRRQELVIWTDPVRKAFVASAEDTVLAKLDWFRQGGEVSERQWKDVLGVIKVQADRLDVEYLRQGAAELAVADLLEKVLTEAGLD